MEHLFTSFTQAIAGAPVLAFVAAALWGMLTVVVTPCNLSSIPLVVALVSTHRGASSKRGAPVALVFALGVLATIAGLGAASAGLGRVVGQVGPAGKYVLAGVFVVMGLHLLDVIPVRWPGPFRRGVKRKGMAAAFAFGMLFGLAAAPCTLAFMAPILGVAFNVGASRMAYATGLMAAYGLGYSGMIVVAGSSAELLHRYLNWSNASRGMTLVKRSFGALMTLAGAGMIWFA